MKHLALYILVFFTCLGQLLFAQKTTISFDENQLKLIQSIQVINKFYVDSINADEYTDNVIVSLLQNLDPHSTFIPAKDLAEREEALKGNFNGIGITFNTLTDTIYVNEVIIGGPSEKAGIQVGDKFIYVNDTLIAGVKKSTKDLLKMLRGDKGSMVKIGVLRKGVDRIIPFKIKRDEIPINSLDAAYMIDDQTAYIKLSRFGAKTYDEFITACKDLKAKGMRKLILDLEYNGGGYLDSAFKIANEFLEKDDLIVYTEGLHMPQQFLKATGEGQLKDIKLIVLINESSASASEIVAGAVQDRDRGVIVGRRSFGKGLVQRQFPLIDNSVVQLTVAKYFTPSGRCIQKPYVKGDNEGYAMDFYNRFRSGELTDSSKVVINDSLKYKTLKFNKTVYGGGGIMPDAYVPMDTTKLTKYQREILNNGTLYRVAMKEVDTNRAQIAKDFKTPLDFINNYKVEQRLLDELIKEGEKEQIVYNEEEFEASKDYLSHFLKFLIARDVYNYETSLRVSNARNPIYVKALKIMENDELFDKYLKEGFDFHLENKEE